MSSATVKSILLSALRTRIVEFAGDVKLPSWQQNRYHSIFQSQQEMPISATKDSIETKARKRNTRISLNVSRARLSNLFDTRDVLIFAKNLQLYHD